MPNRYRIRIEVAMPDQHVDPDLVPDRIPKLINALDKRFPGDIVPVGGSSSGSYHAEMPVEGDSIQEGIAEAIRALRAAAEEVGLPSWPIIGVQGQST
jgi:hypothetical protein